MTSTDKYWPPVAGPSYSDDPYWALIANAPKGLGVVKSLRAGTTTDSGDVPVGDYVIARNGMVHRHVDAVELRAYYAEYLKTAGGNDGVDG